MRAQRVVRSGLAGVLAGVVLALVAVPAAAQADGPVIDRFDVQVQVHPDGSLTVSERIAVDFGDDEHHGIYRTIPVASPLAEGAAEVPEGREAADFRRVLRVRDLAVSASAPDEVEAERDGDDHVIRIGDPDVTVTGEQTYELRYAVDGALDAFDDRAELAWDVVGVGWEWPITAVTAEVDAPGILAADCAAGPPGAAQPCEDVAVADGRVRAAAGPLEPGEGMTVAVGMEPGAVAVPAPLVEERWRLGRALAGGPLAVPLAAITAVLGAVAVILAHRRSRPAADPPASAFRVDPPEGLRPAQLRMLVTARADDAAVSATLFDLAARGYLHLEHLGDDADGSVRLDRTDRDDEGLADHERGLRDGLFGGSATVTSEDFGGDFAPAVRAFGEALEADAVARGWFPAPPSSLRASRAGVAVAILVAAGAVVAAALALTDVALAALPLLAAAIGLVVVRLRRPLHTAEGRRLAAEARAFQAFLRSSAGTAEDLGEEPGPLFGSYLPYAIALDAAPQWVARFRHLAPERWAPVYYAYPLALLHDPDRFTASVGGVTDQVASTTAPTSSTSGGGTTVGGGFGGGGGGGW